MEFVEVIQIVSQDFIVIQASAEIRFALPILLVAVALQQQQHRRLQPRPLVLLQEFRKHLVLFRFQEQTGRRLWGLEWELLQL
jgi:hypothetical protein